MTKELIFKVKGIPIMGRKFYRDIKFSNAIIDEFPKELGESKALIKIKGKT